MFEFSFHVVLPKFIKNNETIIDKSAFVFELSFIHLPDPKSPTLQGFTLEKIVKIRKPNQHILRVTPQFGTSELNLEIYFDFFGAKLMEKSSMA